MSPAEQLSLPVAAGSADDVEAGGSAAAVDVDGGSAAGVSAVVATL